MELAQAIEKSLTAAGLDVLVDDRDQRPGLKFKDADLIGIPLRVVIGERGFKEGKIEVKWRTEAEAKHVPMRPGGRLDPRGVRRGGVSRHEESCDERRRARAAAKPS